MKTGAQTGFSVQLLLVGVQAFKTRKRQFFTFMFVRLHCSHLDTDSFCNFFPPGGLGLDLDHGVHTTGTELWKTSYRTFSTGLCHWHTYCPTCRQHGNLKRWTDYPLAPKSIPEHHVFWYSVSTKYTILTVTP